MLLFAYSLSWVMASIGLKVANPEAAQTAVFLPGVPVRVRERRVRTTVDDAVLAPAFAEHQPVTIVAQAARGLMLGQGALDPGQTVGGQVLLAVVWCIGITVLSAPLAVRIYRHSAN